MVPSDSSLLGEKCIIFVMLRVVNVDEGVGGHISVMSMEIVEYTGVEESVQCRAHSFFQDVEGFFDLTAELWAACALNKVVIIFKFAAARATLSFFITAIAIHLATGWEFSHTMLVCPCLVLLAVIAVHRCE